MVYFSLVSGSKIATLENDLRRTQSENSREKVWSICLFQSVYPSFQESLNIASSSM